MHDRRTLLVIEVIRNPRPDRDVIEELGDYGQASDGPLAMVSRADLIAIIQQFKDDELKPHELKAWAIRLLGRRDIEFEFGPEGALEEALFWIAYQEIADWENQRLCRHIEAMLERRRQPRD